MAYRMAMRSHRSRPNSNSSSDPGPCHVEGGARFQRLNSLNEQPTWLRRKFRHPGVRLVVQRAFIVSQCQPHDAVCLVGRHAAVQEMLVIAAEDVIPREGAIVRLAPPRQERFKGHLAF